MPEVRTPISQVNYAGSLARAWAAHVAAKPDDAPRVVSLFAGGGGSSLGFSMAGFREVAAVEWDANAVETLKFNFSFPIHHGDIGKLSAGQCLSLARVKPGELDVLDGSPPCQGFSTVGKRKFGDERNQLFREYVRLLRGMKPRTFIMENVSGMVKGPMKVIFAECLRELKASGYRVRVRLMNAMYFGVPQDRERLVFIGVREDLKGEPTHPRPETLPIPLRAICPDAIACRSQRINQWIPATRASCTITKTPFPEMILTRDKAKREPTIAELKMIGSFPEPFRFAGSKAQNWQRIGNSVPPLFMRAIASNLRNILAAQ